MQTPAVSRRLTRAVGWRGFLVPELSRAMSFTQLSIVSGIVWATWHYPILLFADYNSGTPAWYGLTCFTVMIVGTSRTCAVDPLASGISGGCAA
jgi:membrane protease YdiL (CAAX protease family)